jgi:hypothetical protein
VKLIASHDTTFELEHVPALWSLLIPTLTTLTTGTALPISNANYQMAAQVMCKTMSRDLKVVASFDDDATRSIGTLTKIVTIITKLHDSAICAHLTYLMLLSAISNQGKLEHSPKTAFSKG